MKLVIQFKHLFITSMILVALLSFIFTNSVPATAETVMVKNINTLQLPAPASGLVDVNGTLFFTVSDPNRPIVSDSGRYGNELWKSDGTGAGTTMVKEFESINTDFLATVKGNLFFFAAEPGQSSGLWKSDGTSAGTVLVNKNIDPKTWADISPEFAITPGGTLYFRTDDGIHGLELWRSDGTEAGTFMVKDINKNNEPDSTGPSHPSSLTIIGETVYFFAWDGGLDHTQVNPPDEIDLWKSDGTEQNTGRGSGRVTGIAPRNPPTPPDMRFSASGD